jgi:replicative superfamily II helicase
MAIDGMAGKWGERDFIHTLQMRLMYGVRPELIELCRIPNIGKVRAEKLWSIKIRTMDDFLQHESKLAKILNISPAKIQESADAIRQIKLKDMMGG